MPITLLLDLDDTLLNTNVPEFVPAYFQALSRHFGSSVKPEAMLAAISSGTQAMLGNDDPALTLQEAFERAFYPTLGVAKAEVTPALDDFYNTVFPTLSAVTSPRNGARELVDWALVRGDRVVLATDPLFPRKAVYERIRWAGLDPQRFELISSYESFHFTKSHSAYYGELLGRLGWPDGPILMVGNDGERDLARAHELGLVTYKVEGATPMPVHNGPGESGKLPEPAGTLADLMRWLDAVDPASLEPSFSDQTAILSILRSTPAALAGLTSGLGAAAWQHEPTPEDWAMVEIVCHLRDTEREVHYAQVETLKNDTQPFVPRPDAAVWAKQRNYLDEDGPRAIAEYTAARKKTLEAISGLRPETWRRAARHAIFGPTNSQEVIGFMADHDRLHIQQAWRTLQLSA